MPKMPQDVKKDDKARTFVPPDNTTRLTEDKNKEINKYLARLKNVNYINPNRSPLGTLKKPQDLKRDEILRSKNQYEEIDLHDVKGWTNRISLKVTERDNIVDFGNNEEIYFRDLANFLYDIMDGKINDFNKEIEYEKKLKNTEKKLVNKTKSIEFIKLYEQFITTLKKILFSDKKSLGRGLTVSSLPILLSKIYTNNSSK